MNYTETFITDITIEELYNEMEYEDDFDDYDRDYEPTPEDLDELSEMFGEYEPDEGFWAYIEALPELLKEDHDLDC
jgi:hypothetical protein